MREDLFQDSHSHDCSHDPCPGVLRRNLAQVHGDGTECECAGDLSLRNDGDGSRGRSKVRVPSPCSDCCYCSRAASTSGDLARAVQLKQESELGNFDGVYSSERCVHICTYVFRLDGLILYDYVS